MPRFLHQLDPDLSDLNMAKRSVNADYKKQYTAQDGLHDNLGQSADVDSIYNTLTTRLVGLLTAFQDLYNILEVGSNSPNFFSAQQRALLQQGASRILGETNAVQLIMSKIKGFNAFTPPQADTLSNTVASISALNDFINGIVSAIGGDIVGQQIADVVQTYERPVALLLQFLEGASRNYKALEVNVRALEGRGRGRKKGGFVSIAPDQDASNRKLMGKPFGLNFYSGGAIVPAFNGEGVFGSDGYRIGDYFSYTDPRRFY